MDKRKNNSFIKVCFSDKQHDKWIDLVNRYYKEVYNDPDNTEIYLHKLLNGGKIDKKAFKAITEEKDDSCCDYNIKNEKSDAKAGIRYYIKECLIELKKCTRILSNRKF